MKMEANIRSNSLANEAMTRAIVYPVARLARRSLNMSALHIHISKDPGRRIPVVTW